ncbi:MULTISPECIES: phosphate propanoyltransferase [Brevibacillus]|jgi:Propanediol utilization protein|uniref:Phosphate propanoyltransferase n=1 Tax=Brevibacillus parabrevis TaxID=54914 RepID=A0A4Y3PPA7_BREPA|nr:MULTISPECIES: phosphate propanoyltransferase [Brevibacillus]MBU8714266.1 phosphate propanoyltransferase [Brevibacillus parabrevis]MDR5001909.1 phosphate propanoyltransferase [Brevibacillus parabrevis]NRQ55856.1 phosphate propanoyltransferase [Brevibacillus sp. HD1.4A]RNB95169.1 phosphate propanoyltransferase [Brevibacillus parabrevis]WDV94231.1 phosphate propanoyltransferase [Brevibacillus parabrevis]
MALITETTLRAMLRTGIPNPFSVHVNDKFTPAASDFLKGRGIRVEVLKAQEIHSQRASGGEQKSIPVGVSNRHIHLSMEDVEKLFGKGYQLAPLRPLSQPGQFAAVETLTLLGPKGLVKGVRILGPARGVSQVEISRTDGFQLGLHPPVRLSGMLEETPGITLIGPAGCVVLEKGVIVAKSHVHMSPEDGRRFQVSDQDTLMLQTTGERPVIFPEVTVRINPRYALDFHLDLDEANAASLKTNDQVLVIGKNGKLDGTAGR